MHRLPGENTTHPSFEEVFAYLRIGHKYQMTHLYERTMAYLKTHFTTSFTAWRRRPNTERSMPLGFDLVHAIGVVNIGRLTSETSVLPLAFWMCCQLGPALVGGFTYSDGERETLCADDLGLCCDAMPKLALVAASTLVGTVLPTASRGCERADGDAGCRETAAVISRLLPSLVKSLYMFPFVRMFTVAANPSTNGRLCVACDRALWERQEGLTQEAWNALPSFFKLDIPEWGDEMR